MKNIFSSKICLLILSFALNTFCENTTEVENVMIERYSTKALFRPSIMPTGMFSVSSNATMSTHKSHVNWDVGSTFGIIKDLQGSASYNGLEFNEFAVSRTINLGLKYNYSSINHLSTSVSLGLPIHIAHKEKSVITDINFGLPAVIYNDMLAGGILHDLFTLTVRPNIACAFNFPLWIGTQVYENLWADVSTSFGKIEMTNEKNQAEWKNVGFWKELPIKLNTLYAFNHYFDLSANIGLTDAMKAKETLYFGLGVEFRGGKIFG
jgi:hypothetical protein